MEHERVRRRAYEIWEREGRPGGRHDDHWGRAAEEIAAEDGGPSQDPAGGDCRAIGGAMVGGV